jgi:uncharacterized protein YsxB (DUF464 family)
MNLNKTLRLFTWINEYVMLHHSSYFSESNNIYLKQDYVLDLMKLNNIIGRFELYLKDKKDKENCVYMVEWFKREMNNCHFDYDDFIEWAEEQESNKVN